MSMSSDAEYIYPSSSDSDDDDSFLLTPAGLTYKQKPWKRRVPIAYRPNTSDEEDDHSSDEDFVEDREKLQRVTRKTCSNQAARGTRSSKKSAKSSKKSTKPSKKKRKSSPTSPSFAPKIVRLSSDESAELRRLTSSNDEFSETGSENPDERSGNFDQDNEKFDNDAEDSDDNMPRTTSNSRKAARKDDTESEPTPPESAKAAPKLNKATYMQMMAKLEELEEQNRELQETASKPLALKTEKINSDHPMYKPLKAVSREHIWRTVKFITKPDEATRVAEKTLDHLIECGMQQPLKQHDRDIWLAQYTGKMVSIHNGTRSYVVSQLKDAANAYLNLAVARGAEAPKLPTEEEMLACANRTTTDMDLLEWYWDGYLPAATANAKHWGADQRHFSLISEAHLDGAPGSLIIPASTEAFAILAFECYHVAWQEQWELKRELTAEHKKKMTLVPKTKYPDNFTEPYQVEGDKVYLYDPKFRGKWTLPDAGQSKFGGWLKQALRRFAAIRKAVRDARAAVPEATEEDPFPDSASLVLEKACLQQLRTKYGITMATADAQRRKNRNKKAKREEPTEEDEEEVEVYFDEE